jgi:hypothetical protein
VGGSGTVTMLWRQEVLKMVGIAIPPFTPGTSPSDSVVDGVVATVVLVVVIAFAVWTYLRSRPLRHVADDRMVELPKAA